MTISCKSPHNPITDKHGAGWSELRVRSKNIVCSIASMMRIVRQQRLLSDQTPDRGADVSRISSLTSRRKNVAARRVREQPTRRMQEFPPSGGYLISLERG
jgi:hypothetical protein